jgi:hypothetical protein
VQMYFFPLTGCALIDTGRNNRPGISFPVTMAQTQLAIFAPAIPNIKR